MKCSVIIAAFLGRALTTLAATPSVCSKGATDYKGDATITSYGGTCATYLAAYNVGLATQKPEVTKWTPATCNDPYYNPDSGNDNSTNYFFQWIYLRDCCTSGITACDAAKEVPQMCSGGNSDMKPDTTDISSDSSGITCKYVKSNFISVVKASLYPITAWSKEVCNAQLRESTVQNYMYSYTASCCNSRASACTTGSTTLAATCFSGSDTVTLEGGASLPLADVRVGDRILTANAAGEHSFADVVFLPHGKNTELAEFVQVTTASGKTVKATKMHLLKTCSSGLAYAGSLKQGDCLRTVDGDDAIEAVNVVVEMGLYTAVTTNEYLVVGGVVASPFAVHHGFTHAYYNLHRALYAVAPSVLKMKGLVAANALLGTTAALAYGLVASSSL